MADNYLEKKMEEHRMRSSAVKLARRMSPSGARPGAVNLKLASQRILVTNVSDEMSKTIVGHLREAGCKVAFMCEDDRLGRELSQKTGSRFYPSKLAEKVYDDLRNEWGGIDLAVIFNDDMSVDPGVERIIYIGKKSPVIKGQTVNIINPAGLSPTEIGGLCVVLTLSNSTCLNGVVLGRF